MAARDDAGALLSQLREFGRLQAVSRLLTAQTTGVDADVVHEQAALLVTAAGSGQVGNGIGDLASWLLSVQPVERGVSYSSLSLAAVADLHRILVGTALPSPAASARVLSFDALSRARTTLDDFSSFYFPLHGLSRDDFFRWLPMLVFVEACIYQLDEDNEEACRAIASGSDDKGSSRPNASTTTLPPAAGADATGAAAAAVRGVLRSHGALTPQVVAELEAGERYWALERSLCASMASCEPIELERVHACSDAKSFDYRVLHGVLCALSGHTASDELRAFMRVDEVLTDMADDLHDYEKDVERNSYNVLRGYVHALGAEAAALALATRIGELECEHERRLQSLPGAVREAYCTSRARALARRPGAEKWVFPYPILQPRQEVESRQAEVDAEAAASGNDGVEEEATVESDDELPHGYAVCREREKIASGNQRVVRPRRETAA